MSTASGTVEHATCLGCGCACDDITVVVRDGRITEARHACPLGVAWFGDGAVPGEVRVHGRDATLDAALDAAAALLAGARRPLVYLAPELSVEAQRAALAIADHLRGVADVPGSATAAGGIVAAQRRGRAAATLGEIRNRADLVLFWGVDPARAYPRFITRYAPDPVGMFVPGGRAGRVVAGVEVEDGGGGGAPADVDLRLRLDAREELDALALLRAVAEGRALPAAAHELAERLGALATALAAARYAVIVADGESPPALARADTRRAEALVALAQTLNDRTRCALVTLRAGGNRNGAEAVMTWQTGFPMCVDFARGVPRYRPDAGAGPWLAHGDVDAVLIAGDARETPGVPAGEAPRVVIGPRASTVAPAPAVAIDTGVAGIHEGGIAFRMDDVPLPLRPSLPTPHDTVAVIGALAARVRRAAAGRLA